MKECGVLLGASPMLRYPQMSCGKPKAAATRVSGLWFRVSGRCLPKESSQISSSRLQKKHCSQLKTKAKTDPKPSTLNLNPKP